MKKIDALIKYEIIDIKRGALIWVTAVLYVIGVQQAISSMHSGGRWILTLVGFIKVSWLPLNFIMIPLLLLSMKIGESENDVFKTMDISPKEIMMSKIFVLLIIDGVMFASNMILAVTLGLLSKASFHYFIYESIGYIINTIIFIVVCNALGLLVGQIIGKGSNVLGFIITIILFILLSNFYKTYNTVVPLIDLRTFSNSFDVISYDKSYIYHTIFWLLITFIILMICLNKYMEKEKLKKIWIQRGILLFLCCICVYFAFSIYSNLPKFYDISNRIDASVGNDDHVTFFGEKDCGYYIDKYIMNINIDNKIKNNCSMQIKINRDKISSLQLGLYQTLNIVRVEVDGSSLKFIRTNNSFIVNLPKEYHNGDVINMKVTYEGKINTTWLGGKELFFVRNNSFFLADVFEWYPKLNDSNIKEYNLNIKVNGKNKIYSNLNDENMPGECKIQGKDKEILLISGNIIEKKYKNYLFIGNEEYVNSNVYCDDLINQAKENNSEKASKIVLSPSIPGASKMDEYYTKAYLDFNN